MSASLQMQEAAFAPQAAAVPTEFPALIHDPVAGDHDRDAVEPVRRAAQRWSSQNDSVVNSGVMLPENATCPTGPM